MLFAKDKAIGAPLLSLNAVQDLPPAVRQRLYFLRFKDLTTQPVRVCRIRTLREAANTAAVPAFHCIIARQGASAAKGCLLVPTGLPQRRGIAETAEHRGFAAR